MFNSIEVTLSELDLKTAVEQYVNAKLQPHARVKVSKLTINGRVTAVCIGQTEPGTMLWVQEAGKCS